MWYTVSFIAGILVGGIMVAVLCASTSENRDFDLFEMDNE